MKLSLPYTKLVSRFFFILIILAILFAPKISSDDPSPFFSKLRNLLHSQSIWIWILIIAVILFLLWLLSNLNKIGASDNQNASPAISLPIGEVVKIANGGSGLASALFRPELKWLNLVGWIDVKDPEKECVIIDGKRTIRSTELFFAPMRLIGKPINARRVLLSPSPLEDIQGKALTSDQLELTLVVSIKYSVVNPIYVASLSAPLSELTDQIIGVLVEQIHANTLEGIVRDDGKLRQAIKDQLQKSDGIRDHYRIDGVLKALPTGDERIIEIIRKTKEAITKQALIEQEGQNKIIEADYNHVIKRAEADIQDEYNQRQHVRDLEIQRLKQEYETLLEFTRSIAQIAASGINPGPAIKEIRTLFTESKPATPLALPKPTTSSLLEAERANLALIGDKVGIKSISVQPAQHNNEQPGKTTVTLDNFSILMDCPADYPANPPHVQINFGEGDAAEIAVPWYAGSNLGDALVAAVMQARVQTKKTRV